jgi:hypothetical protein
MKSNRYFFIFCSSLVSYSLMMTGVLSNPTHYDIANTLSHADYSLIMSSKSNTLTKDDKNSKSKKSRCYEDFKDGKPVWTIFGEWLYFKATEDSLKYAQTTPQNPTFTPISKPVYQNFDYSSGTRLGIGFQFAGSNAELGAEWMWYAPEVETTRTNSSDYSILAVLSLPAYGIDQNSQANEMNGKWMLKMNSIDLNLKMPIHFVKWLVFTPYGGVKAGFVDQNIRVRYGGFELFQPSANTPQIIRGQNNMWGVGPLIGLDLRFLIPCHLDIFFTGSIAGLCGEFDLVATYKDFLNAPSEAKLKVEEHQFRVSMIDQLRAGFEIKWPIRKRSKDVAELSVSAGWEVQVWTRQFRLNMFNSFVEPSDDANLTLYGPFVRGQLRF